MCVRLSQSAAGEGEILHINMILDGSSRQLHQFQFHQPGNYDELMIEYFQTFFWPQSKTEELQKAKMESDSVSAALEVARKQLCWFFQGRVSDLRLF